MGVGDLHVGRGEMGIERLISSRHASNCKSASSTSQLFRVLKNIPSGVASPSMSGSIITGVGGVTGAHLH